MDNVSVFCFCFCCDVFPLQCILTCLCVFYRKWHSHLVSSLWTRHAAICPSPSGTCYRWVDIPCLCVLFVSNTDSCSNCSVKWQRVPDRRAKMREGAIAFHFVPINGSNAWWFESDSVFDCNLPHCIAVVISDHAPLLNLKVLFGIKHLLLHCYVIACEDT